MIKLNDYTDFNICDYINISDEDYKDYDQILISDENLIIIKEYSCEEDLVNHWEEVMYFVGGYIQNKLDELKLDDSYLWNMYIIYFVNNFKDLKIKLTIENNKFCCKKYLIDISKYSSKTEALYKEIPILVDLDFKVNEDIFNLSDMEIKTLICGSSTDIYSRIFINTNEIEKMDVNTLIDKMVSLNYD